MFLQTKMFRFSCKAFVARSITWCLSTLDISTLIIHSPMPMLMLYESQLVFFDRGSQHFRLSERVC